MSIKHSRLLFAILFIAEISNAQSVAKPTPAQTAVLNKIIPAITNTFDKFTGNDWVVNQDFYNNDPLVSKDPDVPFDIDQNFQRDYELDQHSDSYKEQMQPLLDKINECISHSQYDSAEAVGKKIKALSKFTVYAYINYANINIHPGIAGLTQLNLTGCDNAYKAKKDQYGNNAATYWLLFGDWNSAKWDAEHDWLHYHFTHAALTPFVENVVVLIIGDNNYITQKIQSIDWSVIKNALTL
jgi:hypothetical protein